MKNRKLLLIVSIVLALTMSLGGTLAYLTDTDEAVNVMTLGNVDIEQYETDADGNTFVQNQPLYPAYYTGDWTTATATTGAIDKVVSVKNVGTAEAYVRTLLAFEAGNLTKDDFDKYIHTEWKTQPTWVEGAITVKGVNYYVAYVDYDVVAAGANTDESLTKIVMDKTATNEVVKEFGPTYEVLALTQAIQTNNFPDKATAWEQGFGEMNNANVATWFGGIAQIPVNTVSTAAELAAALAKGGTVILAADVEIGAAETESATIPVAMLITEDTVLDLNGNAITFASSDGTTAGIHVLDANLTITGEGSIEQNGSDDFLLWAKGDSTVTIDNGTFVTAANDCSVLYASDYNWGTGADTPTGAVINVYGGTFSSGSAEAQDCANVMNHGAGSINYYGGTFNWHPENNVDADDAKYINVADGYKVLDLENGTYMVVAQDVNNVVGTAEQLAKAVAAGETDIYLADGEYDVYGCANKTLTISGSRNAVIKVMNDGESGCDYAFGSGSAGVGNITFNGVTIDTTSNTGNYKGFAYMKGTFNDCNFVGAYSLNNANDFVFNNCEFDFKNGYFWTYAANKVTFNGCTFNGNSKAILAHGYASTVITISNCEFAATEKGCTGSGDNTACVEIDPAGNNTYTITFTGNNTKTEYYAGWTRVKDGSTDHTINGLE